MVTLLPSVKEFIEENIELVETEDWEAVLEAARLNFPPITGHNLRMKSLADFLISAGFNEVLNAQYKLFDKYVRPNLRDLVLDIKEGIAHPAMKFKGFISMYSPNREYGLLEDEQIKYITDHDIDKSCGAYIYKDNNGDWRVTYA